MINLFALNNKKQNIEFHIIEIKIPYKFYLFGKYLFCFSGIGSYVEIKTAGPD